MREVDTLSAVAARQGIHPNQVRDWCRLFLDGGKATLQNWAKREAEHEAAIRDLHAKIGELAMQQDFLKVLGR